MPFGSSSITKAKTAALLGLDRSQTTQALAGIIHKWGSPMAMMRIKPTYKRGICIWRMAQFRYTSEMLINVDKTLRSSG
ncbi:hypothetical protein Hdeb2414_s0068g00770131 [Helianthus debilis subsp. tardiflorus]